jgi:hypothetical protein
MVEKNGDTQNEINKRIRTASKFYHLIRAQYGIKTETKSVKPQYTMYTLITYYYMETRTCTKREESKIQATETKFSRTIIGKAMTESEMHTSEKRSGYTGQVYRTKLRETS